MPCDGCHLTKLEEAMATERGMLFQRVISLDFALRKGIRVDIAEVPADEFLGLQILEQEQNRHEREQAEEQQKRNGIHR